MEMLKFCLCFCKILNKFIKSKLKRYVTVKKQRQILINAALPDEFVI